MRRLSKWGTTCCIALRAVHPRRYGVILRRVGVFPAPSGQGLLPHGLYLLSGHAKAGHPEGFCVRSAFCPSGLHQRAVVPELPVASPNKRLRRSVRVCRDKPARCERVHVSDSEGRATHAGPESCADDGHVISEALTGERAGRVWSPEIGRRVGCRRAPNTRQATPQAPLRRGAGGPGGVGDPWHAQRHRVRDPGGPAPGLAPRRQVRTVTPEGARP